MAPGWTRFSEGNGREEKTEQFRGGPILRTDRLQSWTPPALLKDGELMPQRGDLEVQRGA